MTAKNAETAAPSNSAVLQMHMVDLHIGCCIASWLICVGLTGLTSAGISSLPFLHINKGRCESSAFCDVPELSVSFPAQERKNGSEQQIKRKDRPDPRFELIYSHVSPMLAPLAHGFSERQLDKDAEDHFVPAKNKYA